MPMIAIMATQATQAGSPNPGSALLRLALLLRVVLEFQLELLAESGIHGLEVFAVFNSLGSHASFHLFLHELLHQQDFGFSLIGLGSLRDDVIGVVLCKGEHSDLGVALGNVGHEKRSSNGPISTKRKDLKSFRLLSVPSSIIWLKYKLRIRIVPKSTTWL